MACMPGVEACVRALMTSHLHMNAEHKNCDTNKAARSWCELGAHVPEQATCAVAGSGAPLRRLQSPSAIACRAPTIRRKGSTASLMLAGLRPCTNSACAFSCADTACAAALLSFAS